MNRGHWLIAAAAVLVLHWVAGTDRRSVFAWLFSAQALGMGIGAFAAGFVVDLSQPHGLSPAFALAGVGFAVSAAMLVVAGRGAAPIVTNVIDGDGAAQPDALAGLATTSRPRHCAGPRWSRSPWPWRSTPSSSRGYRRTR